MHDLMKIGWGCLLTEAELPPSVKHMTLPDRESFADDEKAAFDYVIARDKRKYDATPAARDSGRPFTPSHMWLALLQSPLLAELWARLGDFFMTAQGRGSYSNRERQMVDMAMGNGSVHIKAAVAEGISPRDIQAIWDDRLEDIDPADRQLVEYVRAVVDRNVTRDAFESLALRMGLKTAMEYTGFITYKCGLLPVTAAVSAMQGVVFEAADDRKLLKDIVDGTVEAAPYLDDSVFKETSQA